MPRAKWRDVRRFCEAQGHALVRGDHDRYLKPLPDGSSSRTKISHGADADEVPETIWKDVWRRQLRLADEAEFWRGVTGESVRYDIPATPEPSTMVPPYLHRFLRDVLHYTDVLIAGTDRPTAQRLFDDYHSQSLTDDADG